MSPEMSARPVRGSVGVALAKGRLGVPCASPPRTSLEEAKKWPEPFWSGGASRPLVWHDDLSDAAVHFQAMLVEPWDGHAASPRHLPAPRDGVRLPLVVYFAGLGSFGGIGDMKVAQLRGLIHAPFVLVAPVKQRQMSWWVLSRDGDWGWVDGDFMPARVRVLSAWIRHLASAPGINAEWLSLLGYSAGAYTATEIFAHNALQVRSLVLGGVHGHGQPDLENLDDRRVHYHRELGK